VKWHRNREYPLKNLVTHEFKIEDAEEGIKLHRQWNTMKVIVAP